MLYDYVIKICEQKNMTPYEVEKKAKLPKGTIEKFEKSKPLISTVLKVADALDTDANDMVREALKK